MNFTADRISSFKCEPGKQQTIYWDAKTPGLGLRVTAGGAKSYIFESRLHGKTVRMTIGDIRTWAIGKAQIEATALKTLTDKGTDPRLQRAEQRAKAEAARAEEMRREATVGEIWPVYLQARKAKWSEGHYQDHVRAASSGGEIKKRGKGLTAPGPLSALMPLAISELTDSRIADWLKVESEKRPTSASLSFRLLRAFLRWAAETPTYRDILPANALGSRVVRESLPQPRAKDGDSLQREQLAQWFDAVRRLPNPVTSAYLQALLLTGARRREMAALRWEDVDFQWRQITIKDKATSKGGETGTRTIPLTPYLLHLLSVLPRRNEWVFSSLTSTGGMVAEPRMAHTKALEGAGLPHLSIHGLRRSFGTLCEWVEVPSGISAQIMGHSPSALAEKHYRRRPIDLLRTWHDEIERWILEQAKVSFTAPGNRLRLINAA